METLGGNIMTKDYYNKTMIADTDQADGSVFFDRESMTFKPRSYDERQYEFTIRYADIQEIRPYRGLKSTVVIITKDNKYTFHMYKLNTFVDQVESGRKFWNSDNIIDAEVRSAGDGKRALSDDELEKLSKLAELHDQGVLNDAQFEEEKNIILNRK